jgi:ribokinase
VVSSIEEAKVAACAILDQGAKQVLITLGENGLLLHSQERSVARVDPVHIEGLKVDHVVDSVGAGDCFVGSFAYFLAIGYDDVKAAKSEF